MVTKEFARGKVVYRPPERALFGVIVMAPDEAPNHIQVTMDDGTKKYIQLTDVVSIEEN